MFLRTILEKVSCFDAPARLGTKGANYGEYQIQTCLSLSTSLFWYKSKITNLPPENWLKGKLKQYKLALPSCYRHPNQATGMSRTHNTCVTCHELIALPSYYRHPNQASDRWASFTHCISVGLIRADLTYRWASLCNERKWCIGGHCVIV